MAQTNKLVLSIFALIASISHAQPACDQVICASVVKAQKICTDQLVVKNGCGACHNITAKDFMDAEGNLSQTVVIDQPGRWCLCENINFNPAPDAGFQPAIQILSSDVHLDLGEYTLRQTNASIQDIYGVLIGEGYITTNPELTFQNITITNGTVLGFTGVGIFAYNPTFDNLETPFAYESFIFSNLDVLECGTSPSFNYFASGINLDSANHPVSLPERPQVAFTNIQIQNCNVNRTLGNSSIGLFTGDSCVIQNTHANDLVTDLEIDLHPAVNGVFNYNIICDNFQMFNCQGNGARHLDPTPGNGGQVGGISLEICQNIYVKYCQFNDFFGEAVDIVNNNLSLATNSIFENCQFNNARGGDNAVIIAGVHMSDGPGQTITTHGMKFINCQFNGSRVSDNNPGESTGAFVAGTVMITLNNVVFENCQSCNNVSNNPNFATYGFFVTQYSGDPVYPFGDVHNITLKDCVVSDISGLSETVGFSLANGNGNSSGNQGLRLNCVVENCIAERIHSTTADQRVAGIAEYTVPFYGTVDVFPRLQNLYVNNCRVSDVRSTATELPSFLSAGILVESVVNPVLLNNTVSDCDRGILLTGTNQIIPNGFQVALSPEDASAFPPVFVDLGTLRNVAARSAAPGGYISGPNGYGDLSQANRYETALYLNQSIDNVEFGLFNTLANRGTDKNYNIVFRVYDSDASGDMPNNILKEVTVNVGDITFNPGAVEYAILQLAGLELNINTITSPYFFIAVDFSEVYLSADPYLAGLFLTIQGTVPVNRAYTQLFDTSWLPYNSPDNWGFNGDLWINPQLCLNSNPTDCSFVNNAQNPSVPYVWIFDASAYEGQTFTNLGQSNTATLVDVDSQRDFIFPAENLNTLGWQSGDPIFYDCQGGDALPDLVCSTTYYAIVYSPGFARNGVIQNNEVDNCGVSGYQDDAPTTSSAWVNNFAFNNGTPATITPDPDTNYVIQWAGTAPVYPGDLAAYPTGSAKAYNISLIP